MRLRRSPISFASSDAAWMLKAAALSSEPRVLHETGAATGAPGRARKDQGRIAVAFFLLRNQSMKIRPTRRRLLIVATKRVRCGFAPIRAKPSANASVSCQARSRSSGAIGRGTLHVDLPSFTKAASLAEGGEPESGRSSQSGRGEEDRRSAYREDDQIGRSPFSQLRRIRRPRAQSWPLRVLLYWPASMSASLT